MAGEWRELLFGHLCYTGGREEGRYKKKRLPLKGNLSESGRRDSNPRPSAWKANALSTELLPQIWWAKMDSNHRRRKPADLQSAPFGHSGTCPTEFQKKSGRRDSNPRPSAWKANALSTELLPQIWWAKMDSNHRRRKPADLQSAPFGHSGICPSATEKLVLFSIALQRYDYFFNLQTKSIIFIAVTAHSSPLFPNLPPARSSACCMLLVVIRP